LNWDISIFLKEGIFGLKILSQMTISKTTLIIRKKITFNKIEGLAIV